MGALELLHACAEGEAPELAGEVVVVGGGDEAVAAARTALRLGARVTILWDGERRRMPCFSERVDAAEQEGVHLELEAAPVRIAPAAGGLAVECRRGEEEFILEASAVVAGGQRAVDAALFESLGIETRRGRPAVDRSTLATNLPGVFLAGEAASGPSAAVRAVGAGRLAALSIGQYLADEPVRGEPQAVNVHMGRLDDEELAALLRGVGKRARVEVRSLDPTERRRSFEEVEQGLAAEEARREAARCLQCDCLARDECALREYATEYGAAVRRFRGERRAFERDETHPEVVYEAGKCILCGLCVRIAERDGVRPGVSFAGRGFPTRVRVPFEGTVAEGLGEAARRCAEACPTGALALRPEARAGDAAPRAAES
jgi:ferredoxin